MESDSPFRGEAAVRYDRGIGKFIPDYADWPDRAADAWGNPGRIGLLGVGTGTELGVFRRRHPTADIGGVDPEPDMVAIARARFPSERIQIGVARDLPADRDAIYAGLVLHFLTDFELASTLLEVRARLRPQGVFAFTVFLDLAAAEIETWIGWIAGQLHGSPEECRVRAREVANRTRAAIQLRDWSVYAGFLHDSGFAEIQCVARTGPIALGTARRPS